MQSLNYAKLPVGSIIKNVHSGNLYVATGMKEDDDAEPHLVFARNKGGGSCHVKVYADGSFVWIGPKKMSARSKPWSFRLKSVSPGVDDFTPFVMKGTLFMTKKGALMEVVHVSASASMSHPFMARKVDSGGVHSYAKDLHYFTFSASPDDANLKTLHFDRATIDKTTAELLAKYPSADFDFKPIEQQAEPHVAAPINPFEEWM